MHHTTIWNAIYSLGFYFLTLAVLCIPVQTVCRIAVPHGRLFLFDIFIGLSALSMVLLLPHRISRIRSWQMNGFILALTLFFLVMALSAVLSEDPKFSIIRLLRVCHVIIIALVSRFFLTDTARLEKVITVWLVSATGAILMGLIGIVLFYVGINNSDENPFIRGYGSLPSGHYPRVGSLFSGFNKFCGYLTVTAALVWYSWLNHPQKKRYPLLLSGLIVAAVFTFSPGLGGLLLVLGVLVARLPAKNSLFLTRLLVQKWGVWLGTFAACTFLLATTLSPVDLLNRQVAGSPRLKTWTAALQTIRDNPFIGLGLGLTGIEVEYHSASGVTQVLASAHNTWLSVGAQSGVCGIIALLIIVVYLFDRRGNGTIAESQSHRQLINLTLKIAVIGGFFYHGLIQSTEWFRYQWVLWGMLAASNSLLNTQAGNHT